MVVLCPKSSALFSFVLFSGKKEYARTYLYLGLIELHEFKGTQKLLEIHQSKLHLNRVNNMNVNSVLYFLVGRFGISSAIQLIFQSAIYGLPPTNQDHLSLFHRKKCIITWYTTLLLWFLVSIGRKYSRVNAVCTLVTQEDHRRHCHSIFKWLVH